MPSAGASRPHFKDGSGGPIQSSGRCQLPCSSVVTVPSAGASQPHFKDGSGDLPSGPLCAGPRQLPCSSGAGSVGAGVKCSRAKGSCDSVSSRPAAFHKGASFSSRLAVPPATAPLNSRGRSANVNSQHAFAEAPLFGSETPAANASPCAPDVERTVSFRSWAMKLAPLILRARAPFFKFPLQNFAPTAGQPFLPLRTPFSLCRFRFPGVFRHCDPQLGSRARGKVAVKRAAHVAVMALNYLHNNLLPPSLLRRRPNLAQGRALDLVYRLCRACGAVEDFSIPSAGRRHPELLARLGDLSDSSPLWAPLMRIHMAGSFSRHAASSLRRRSSSALLLAQA